MLEQSPLASARDVFPETRCVQAGRGVSSFVAIFARLSDLFSFFWFCLLFEWTVCLTTSLFWLHNCGFCAAGTDRRCPVKDITCKEIKEGVGICQTQRVAARCFLHWNKKKSVIILKPFCCLWMQFKENYLYCVGRDSSVGIATELLDNLSEDRVPMWTRFSHSSRPNLGSTQLPVPLVPGKATGEWRWHPPPRAPKLRKEYKYTSTPPPPPGSSWLVLGWTLFLCENFQQSIILGH